EASEDFIPDTLVNGELLVFATTGSGRIIERPVNSFGVTGENRATLIGTIANGDHIVERLVKILIHRFRTLDRDIDADFSHCPDRQWTDMCRFRSGGMDFEAIARNMSQKAFRHLRTCR